MIQHKRHANETAAFLHRDEHASGAQRQLHDLVRRHLVEAVETGDVRGDVGPDELADYCLYALAAAGRLSSDRAVRRLVAVTVAGLLPGTMRA